MMDAIRRILLVVFLALPLTGVFTAMAMEPIGMGIITGGTKGTYFQFGLDMQKLLKPQGFNLSVYESSGSVENIFAVYQRPRTQMGIVQSDVLAFVAKVQTDPVLQRIANRIKMVFPLYNEEIHLLGRSDISEFDDLAGRRVAIGQDGSGTYLTAKLLFEVSEVAPAEMVSIGTDEALAELKAGRIDAMFYVAGFPVKLFREGVTAADELALVPILNKNILEFYPAGEIPAGTYEWQPAAVKTAAVKAVLISYDFRRANCEYVGRVARIIADNLAWLRQNGHPKWQAVDIDYPLKGWEQYDCVRNYLDRSVPQETKPPAEINPVLDAIKRML
jgi:TRAP transporter TAXI family solute receptor